MNPVELLMRRRQMEAFIAAERMDVRLIRTPLTETAAGGYIEGDPVTLPPQPFRRVPFKRRLTVGVVNTPDGDIKNTDFILLGMHTADIREGDDFTLEGEMFDVKWVDPRKSERVAAVCTWRGRAEDGNTLPLDV